MSLTESQSPYHYGLNSHDAFSVNEEKNRKQKIETLRSDTSYANGNLPSEKLDLIYKIERFEELNDINYVGTVMYGD